MSINYYDAELYKRRTIAEMKHLYIGGRLFCWHDWTLIYSFFPGNFYYCMCVKCGKEKYCYSNPIEFISTY